MKKKKHCPLEVRSPGQAVSKAICRTLKPEIVQEEGVSTRHYIPILISPVMPHERNTVGEKVHRKTSKKQPIMWWFTTVCDVL